MVHSNEFTPLFEDSLNFVKRFVINTERRFKTRMVADDLAELLLTDIENQDDSELKQQWEGVHNNIKKALLKHFAEEALALRKAHAWK